MDDASRIGDGKSMGKDVVSSAFAGVAGAGAVSVTAAIFSSSSLLSLMGSSSPGVENSRGFLDVVNGDAPEITPAGV